MSAQKKRARWRTRWKLPDCMDWWGFIQRDGYGSVFRNGVTIPVHRAAYEYVNGPIPEGLVIDHLCRNRSCVNPDHMEPVTRKTNTLRGTSPMARNARKRRCHKGHWFTPENTTVRRSVQGGLYRVCKRCKILADREFTRKKFGLNPRPSLMLTEIRPKAGRGKRK